MRYYNFSPACKSQEDHWEKYISRDGAIPEQDYHLVMPCVLLFIFLTFLLSPSAQTKMVQHIRKKHPEYPQIPTNTIHVPLTTAVISATPAVLTADSTSGETVVVRILGYSENPIE